MDLPPEILTILANFAPLFSRRVWPLAHTLLLGAILVNGRRTVASALRIIGLAQEPHFTNYHRVLNRAAWSALAAARILLGLIVAILPLDAPIILAADDTIGVTPRNGKNCTLRRLATIDCPFDLRNGDEVTAFLTLPDCRY